MQRPSDSLFQLRNIARKQRETDLFKFIKETEPKIVKEDALIISDVHANHPALKLALEFAKSNNIECIISLGDMVDYNPYNNEVLQLLFECNLLIAIRGNHDYFSIFMDDVITHYEKLKIDPTLAKLVEALPTLDVVQFGTKKILLCHSNPWVDDNYIFPNDTPMFDDLLENIPCNGFFYGHTHFVTYYENFNKIVFNPGSLGASRSMDRMLTFAHINIGSGKIKTYGIKHSLRNYTELLSGIQFLQEYTFLKGM